MRVLARPGAVPVGYGLVYALISLAMSWPIFLGYVPLPAEIITQSALWGPFQEPIVQRFYGSMGDLVYSFYSGHRLIGEAVRGGEIPLWNPYVLNGFPMHAANAMGVFAPQTILAYLLPIDLAWTMAFVTRPVMAALGTALYSRALGLSHAAAISSGLIFGWSGFQVAWDGQAMVDIMTWAPWVMLGMYRVAERPTPARVGLASIAFAMPTLIGHPEVAAYVILMGAGSVLLYVWTSPARPGAWPSWFSALGGLFAVGALSLMLAAIQLLPTIEWIPQLRRSIFSTSEPMPVFDIFNFLVRHIAAAPINVLGTYIPNGAMYAGLVTLLVASVALVHRRWREVWFYLLVLAVSLQFSFGWGPFFWLHQASPVPIDFPKTRIIALADFSLAMLAAFGLDALTATNRKIPRWLLMVLATSLVAVAGLLLFLPDAGPLIDDAADPLTGPRSIFQGRPFSLALVLATGVAVAWPAMRRRARPSSTLLCGLIAVDMLTFAYGHMPFAQTDLLLATPPAIQFLQENVDASERIFATRSTIPYNWEAQFRLATPAGYLYVTRPVIEVMLPITGDGRGELRHDLLLQQRSPLIDALGVRYVVTNAKDGSGQSFAAYPDRFPEVYDDGYVRIFENPRALPRARLVPCGGIEIQPFQRRAISRVNSPAFDHATQVILEEKIPCPSAKEGGGSGETITQSVEVLAATFNTYGVRANVTVPSMLVFADTYYVGWRAYVDGREVPIVRANHAFKAIQVDPGQHLVNFVFDPLSFRLGASITIAGLVILALLFGWSIALHRTQRGQAATAVADRLE